MTFKNTMPRLLGLLSLLAISIPAFAATGTQDFDRPYPPGRPGWGHHGCFRQREIEFDARRLTDQVDRFRFAAERAPGFERLARGAFRLSDAVRDFSFRIERARDCEDIRFEFRNIEDVYYRVERHYFEIQQRGAQPDRNLDEEFRQLTFAFQELRREVEGYEYHPGPGPVPGPRPFPGNPGYPLN